MAVYTPIDKASLEVFVKYYDIGSLQHYEGIAEGIENTNYLLVTSKDRYILTLYEKRVRPEDLPFFLGLMRHLANRHMPCPLPVVGRDGGLIYTLAGRPAALQTFLPDRALKSWAPPHLAELGRGLARLHLAAADFPMRRANDFSLAGWKRLAGRCTADGDQAFPGIVATIQSELSYLERYWPTGLPSGVIHGDLFPDNVFFRGDTLSGFIDFYFACSDFWAMDLAICINAWCFHEGREFALQEAQTFLQAYASIRSLTEAEKVAFPILLRGNALRFLLTRLHDWLYNRPEGALLTPKDPNEYWRILTFHQNHPGLLWAAREPDRGSFPIAFQP